MIKSLYIISFLLSYFTLSISGYGQANMKFGKVPMEDLKMTVYENDTTAEAAILGEESYYNIGYTTGGFKLIMEVHRRIKILHKDAIDAWGNITFSLYENSGGKESLGSFKGYTFNLDGGKVVEEKIALKDAFKERSSENTSTYKFTFNNVQVGSVIEYSYKIYSDFYGRVPKLYFQRAIPVRWSELTFEYPEFFKYKYFMTGSEPVYKSEFTSVNESVGSGSIAKTRDYWVLKDIPALKQLSYMGQVTNYRTKINYELYGVEIPGSVYENYSASWEEINHDLVKSESFGQLLDRLGPTKELAASLGVDTASNMVKINAAVNYVQSNFLYNEYTGVYPSSDWRKNLKEQKGSAAELSFTLIGILKNLGIKAYPVILSTRNNGAIFRSFPATEDFNYVITAIEYEGKYLLVDPTSEYTGINILPEYCLNGEGMMVREEGLKWLPIEVGNPYDITEFVQFKLDDELKVTAEYQAKYDGYAAYNLRESISDNGGEEKYISDAMESYKDQNIANYSFENLDDLSQPVIKKYTISPDDYIEEMGDIFLFKPILYPNFSENPFKKDKRTFPVDF
ncbi:MAG: DUF3857 domain-containing protein, partial [Bacteroidales bacterium]|nr:DUF3857 domain-containing protein [Bacteroidales bacterium]